MTERQLHREHRDPEKRVNNPLLYRRRELRRGSHVRLSAHRGRRHPREGQSVHSGERLEVRHVPVAAPPPLGEVNQRRDGKRHAPSDSHRNVAARFLGQVSEVKRGYLGE